MSISRPSSKELKTVLKKLSVIIPAYNESENLKSCITSIEKILSESKIDREIIVINDNSTDNTNQILENLCNQFKCLRVIKNKGKCGFGRAVRLGLQEFSGDAVVIMMADLSDSPHDLIQYWRKLQEGQECVFGSRFIEGGRVINYPVVKLIANRIVNTMIRFAFNIKCNDITNAFKIYRREVIEGCRPFISPHFNLTVEIPLKAIIRGYSWDVIPISWRNRTKGVAKLKLREMGSRYFFIIAYLWLEKYFSRGDYRKK
jgi:dolichol-phosphate mannosyltransferase